MPSVHKKYLFAVIIIFTGIILKFIFIHDVIKSPHLNILLPGTDEFNYFAVASDDLSENPVHLKMTVYPAYLYLIKSIFKIFGTDIFNVYYIHLFLSLLSVVLLFFIGNILFGIIPGIICGFLYLFYKMNFVYNVILIPTSVSQFLIISMMFFFFVNQKYPNIKYYIGFLSAGILTCFFRPFFWLLFIPGIIFLFIKEKHLKFVQYISVNVFVIFISLYLFNTFHTPESFLHKFGIMFYIANHEKATGILMPLPDIPMTPEAHCKNSLKIAYFETKDKNKVNTFWIRKTFESIKNYPYLFIKLLFKKINIIVNNYEIHNNENVYFYEKNSILKYIPKINFSFIFCFALTGIFLSFLNKKNYILLFPLIYLTIMIFTMPLCSRYRMPIVPFLCLFAGYGINELLGFVKTKNHVRILISIIIIVLSLFWSHLKITGLDKAKDLQFWENSKEKKINHQKFVEKGLKDYQNIKTMPLEKAYALTLTLGRLHCYREFFDAAENLMPLIKNENLKFRLLKQEAHVYETIFNFDKAVLKWEQIKACKSVQKLAEHKTQELKIYKSLLN